MTKRKGAEPLAEVTRHKDNKESVTTYISKSTESQPTKKSNLDWAIEYAQKGFHVFPCHYVMKDGACSCKDGKDCDRLGKHPTTKHGLLEGTTDLKQIRLWWMASPHSNIGITTGKDLPGGGMLIVIDIDNDKRKGKMGDESLAELVEQFGEPTPTLMQRTGSGGFHYLYKSDKPYKNDNNGRIGKDIDARGQDGYIIVPPSNHYTGGHYAWINDLPIAEVPDWLVASLGIKGDEPVAGKKGKAAKAKKVDASEDSKEEFTESDLKGLSLTKQDVIKLLAVIPSDDRDTWWKVGAALKHEYEEDGLEIWDEWSQKSDNYSAQILQSQWRSFKPDNITLGSIVHFAKENGWKGFDAEAADSPEIKAGWIFVVGIKRYINLDTMQELDQEQYNCQFAPLFKRGKASEHTLRNEAFDRVDGITYCPAQPQLFKEKGLRKLNLWRPSGVTPEPGDVSLFLNHVAYLFPDPDEQKIVLDYMAFQVQYPGQKVHWALLIQGLPGNGKSYIGHVMKCVLGEHNVANVDSQKLHENYTAWQKNTQFVIVEEMMASGKHELMNKLKPMITEPWCSIREMYKPAYEQPNRFNFLFLTNHDDAIVIDKTDRRYCVLRSPAVPHKDGIPGYYKPLFDWTDKHAPSLLHCLQSRDLSQFVPQAHAPMTAAKQDLIAESLPPLDQFIKERVEAAEWPFNVDLVRSCDLAPVLPDCGFGKVTPQAVGKALRRLEYTDLGKKRFDKDTDTKWPVWAVRNASTYLKMKTAQLIQMFVKQQNDGGRPSDADIMAAHNAMKATKPENPLKQVQPM